MHIVDGALANPVVIGGAVAAAGGIALGLRAMTMERIPAAGVLSAAFFVASLVHVPIGPSSVHLILNGMAGLVLGWAAFPALFVGLLLQAVFFGFGGVTVLGVNTFNIAMPAVIVGLVLGPLIRRGGAHAAIWGGVGGALAIALTTLCVAICLALSGDQFLAAAKLVFLAHIPVMAVEAVLTAAAVSLALRVKPELFHVMETTR
ncbi:cobalt transporter CbiM [Rhodobacter capsulatus]|uniref:Cobalt/nickel transport system permease protein n=1 Tax=Rhodobacter capsulatus TaxID=1061 RepID=A0A0Q0QGC5_RHOCA|nr:cobalt transporter CbiM [Rhodobacter capsulatus]KQB13226.1 cobalamin biosynthesis protein CbiM [Rhodobacter capsulatus]KQB13773.1 cobalamin biosynthesis protein CbiM [Rhodobacter capsulatus]PZX21394.1 cobalt/nickel transport system permease protein [Rhodobacter capsulatus]QNR62118.1 cobalt transporter CbiM [Rhodobacter capsulatus]WER10494.1 cobalt transporter CbiM [Rhodobacter capsulatus]